MLYRVFIAVLSVVSLASPLYSQAQAEGIQKRAVQAEITVLLQALIEEEEGLLLKDLARLERSIHQSGTEESWLCVDALGNTSPESCTSCFYNCMNTPCHYENYTDVSQC